MKLSIVATLYCSSAYVDEFHRRASAAAQKLVGDDYEIVLVNDGSPDDSLERAIRLSESHPQVVVVDLSRNFGHHKAMMTGLAHARGDFLFLLDSDLEESPEWLTPFAEQLARDDCDVVYGVQDVRKGAFVERISGPLFYRTIRAMTGLAIPDNIVTARLMRRRYVEALLRHDEREVFMAGLWCITGFDQRAQLVRKISSSATTYTLGRKMAVLVNSVTSFSNAPLIAIFYLGLVISLIAGLSTAYLVMNWLFFAQPLRGWTSVMASVWLLGGLIISFIGIIGIYLSKIFMEAKRRPYTIVRQVYGRPEV
ncbi:MAG TPA: glycosyltransferase family 2 protein [Pseudolabrys sp.]|jgi:putative glycosyltransferase|nr:glycosyltransferase family 2 protein [Pseudolabrys sp.]